MANVLRGTIAGAIALGGFAFASPEASAMPISGFVSGVESSEVQSSPVQNVYWRYGYGWHRPWGWRYGYGGRRPFGWRVYHPLGWGGYRPYWGHRWRRW